MSDSKERLIRGFRRDFPKINPQYTLFSRNESKKIKIVPNLSFNDNTFELTQKSMDNLGAIGSIARVGMRELEIFNEQIRTMEDSIDCFVKILNKELWVISGTKIGNMSALVVYNNSTQPLPKNQDKIRIQVKWVQRYSTHKNQKQVSKYIPQVISWVKIGSHPSYNLPFSFSQFSELFWDSIQFDQNSFFDENNAWDFGPDLLANIISAPELMNRPINHGGVFTGLFTAPTGVKALQTMSKRIKRILPDFGYTISLGTKKVTYSSYSLENSGSISTFNRFLNNRHSPSKISAIAEKSLFYVDTGQGTINLQSDYNLPINMDLQYSTRKHSTSNTNDLAEFLIISHYNKPILPQNSEKELLNMDRYVALNEEYQVSTPTIPMSNLIDSVERIANVENRSIGVSKISRSTLKEAQNHYYEMIDLVNNSQMKFKSTFSGYPNRSLDIPSSRMLRIYHDLLGSNKYVPRDDLLNEYLAKFKTISYFSTNVTFEGLIQRNILYQRLVDGKYVLYLVRD